MWGFNSNKNIIVSYYIILSHMYIEQADSLKPQAKLPSYQIIISFWFAKQLPLTEREEKLDVIITKNISFVASFILLWKKNDMAIKPFFEGQKMKW